MRAARGGVRVALAVVGSLVLGVAAYLAATKTLYAFDDSFISYRYAQQLVLGNGLVYTAGERVEGYTNFAWVLLAAAGIAAGADPLELTRKVGIASYVLSCVLALMLVLWSRRSFRYRDVLALPMLTMLVTTPGYSAFAGTGLETSFVGLLILVLGAIQHQWRPEHRAGRLLGASCAAVLLLTRLDSAIAVGVSGIVYLIQERARWRVSRRGYLAAVAWSYLPAFLVVVAFFAWRRWYYDAWLPNTYFAKSADVAHWTEGMAYLKAFLKHAPVTLVLVPLALLATGRFSEGRRAPLPVYACGAATLHVLYTVRAGGDFMEWRFMWEYWPLFVCAATMGLVALLEHARAAVLLTAALALAVLPGPTQLETKYGMQSLKEMNGYATLGRRVGTALDATLPEGTLVATTLAGTAYFAPRLRFLDQWGLNDHHIARLRHTGTVHRGHIKFSPLEYVRARGANFYMAHPLVCSCSSPCKENKPNAFFRLDGGDQCVRTWYLGQTPELTAALCRQPERVVLTGVDCPKTVH